MLFLKSMLFTCSIFSVGTAPVNEAPVENAPKQYCYNISITATLPHVGDTNVTVNACGDSPEEGLMNLGAAVRELHDQQVAK